MRSARRSTSLALILTLTLAPAAWAQPEDPAHAELRALRTEVLDAITTGDIDRVLTSLHPDVVITWQNGEVNRGRDGVKAFFERMGRQAFSGYQVPPTPDDLTVLYVGGQAGVSFGRSVGQFNLLGASWEFENRWTATVVKQDGKWLLTSYHVSWNALDNALLTAAKRAVYYVSPVAFLAGLALGVVVMRRRRRAP
jgi:ketosteroid isomerase-like protein